LSHALGTPLNVIAGRAAMIGMAEELDANDVRENARIIETQVRNITDLVQRALKFVREGGPEPARIELGALALRVASLLGPLAASRDVSLALEPGESIEAVVPVSRLFDVLAGLTAWGVSRVTPAGSVAISLRRGEPHPPPVERGRARGGAAAVIEIACRGTALPLGMLEHVYEPWLHDGSVDRDTALTLAVAFGIAREHRGWIEAAVDDSSTTFRVCWPI
jgi:nitrogen-specific signal transduction histidine kinase